MSETTVKLADFPLNATFVVCFSPVPLIVTNVPTGPLGGVNEVVVGVTSKVRELVSVVDPVLTVTGPVSAADGTVADRYVVPERVTVVA